MTTTETKQQRVERLVDALPPDFMSRSPEAVRLLIKEAEDGIPLSLATIDYLERLDAGEVLQEL